MILMIFEHTARYCMRVFENIYSDRSNMCSKLGHGDWFTFCAMQMVFLTPKEVICSAARGWFAWSPAATCTKNCRAASSKVQTQTFVAFHVPAAPKGWFLDDFMKLKTSKKRPFGGAGYCFYFTGSGNLQKWQALQVARSQRWHRQKRWTFGSEFRGWKVPQVARVSSEKNRLPIQ